MQTKGDIEYPIFRLHITNSNHQDQMEIWVINMGGHCCPILHMLCMVKESTCTRFTFMATCTAYDPLQIQAQCSSSWTNTPLRTFDLVTHCPQWSSPCYRISTQGCDLCCPFVHNGIWKIEPSSECLEKRCFELPKEFPQCMFLSNVIHVSPSRANISYDIHDLETANAMPPKLIATLLCTKGFTVFIIYWH